MNNLDPGQASMDIFLDTMYTFSDTEGGSKLTTFSNILLLSQHPVDLNIACTDSEGGWGEGFQTPLEKHKLNGSLYGISNWTPPPGKKLDNPPPGKKCWTHSGT